MRRSVAPSAKGKGRLSSIVSTTVKAAPVAAPAVVASRGKRKKKKKVVDAVTPASKSALVVDNAKDKERQQASASRKKRAKVAVNNEDARADVVSSGHCNGDDAKKRLARGESIDQPLLPGQAGHVNGATVTPTFEQISDDIHCYIDDGSPDRKIAELSALVAETKRKRLLLAMPMEQRVQCGPALEQHAPSPCASEGRNQEVIVSSMSGAADEVFERPEREVRPLRVALRFAPQGSSEGDQFGPFDAARLDWEHDVFGALLFGRNAFRRLPLWVSREQLQISVDAESRVTLKTLTANSETFVNEVQLHIGQEMPVKQGDTVAVRSRLDSEVHCVQWRVEVFDVHRKKNNSCPRSLNDHEED